MRSFPYSLAEERKVLFGGVLYFLAVLILALRNYEAKFIMDGFSHIFFIANFETFTSALGRHVLYFQQAGPVIAANLGASIPTIMKVYVVNDVAFYFLCFLLVLFVLKDTTSALLLVSVHVFGMPFNHFMMVGELHPGSMFAVISLSIFRHWGILPFWKRSIIIPGLYFTVSSHPLALVSLVVATTFFFVLKTDSDSMIGRKGLLCLIICCSALKLLLVDPYDIGTVQDRIRNELDAVLVFFQSGYALKFIWYMVLSSPVVTMLLASSIIGLVQIKRYPVLLLLIGFLFGWSWVMNQYLDFSQFSIDSLQRMMANRYAFPIKFVVLFTFFHVLFPRIRSFVGDGFHATPVVMSFWGVGFMFLVLSSIKANGTIAELRHTVHLARQQGKPKAYYDRDDYCNDIYIHRDAYFATLILSSMDSGEQCHIIHVTEEDTAEINSLPDDLIYLMPNLQLEIDSLNPERFKVSEVAYDKLDYRCERATLGDS